MKILQFGENGQVSWELNRSLLPLGELIVLGRKDADFAEPENLRKIISDINPDLIINAVAYTAVDKAEEEEQLASVINATAPGVIAEEAAKINALFVSYSTDYVFDGNNEAGYLENHKTNPVNAYGRTKLAGEQAIQSSGCDYLIFRTSWVYASRGHNFLLTILRLAKEKSELKIISDQFGSPTSARLIAETTLLCINKAMVQRKAGVFVSDLYHLTTSGNTSWHGFATEIIGLANRSSDDFLAVNDIKAIPSTEYPVAAQRPANSKLQTNKLEQAFEIEMPFWKAALDLCLREVIT